MSKADEVLKMLDEFVPTKLPEARKIDRRSAYREFVDKFVDSGDECWSRSTETESECRKLYNGIYYVARSRYPKEIKVAMRDGRVYVMRTSQV